MMSQRQLATRFHRSFLSSASIASGRRKTNIMRINMSSLTALLVASSSRAVSAFTTRTVAPVAARAAMTTRHMASGPMASGPMPYDDEKMPIYALGLNIGMQISSQTDFKTLLEEDELAILLNGFEDVVKGENTANPMEVLQKYGPAVNELLRDRTEKIVERVKKDGEEYIEGFLDCNDEAVKTDSGLVYYSMKEGDGASPEVADEVEVHYHGTLVDGTVFDSSVERGATIKFKLGQVIKGWQEGLAMMKEGGKATLVIPPGLAYGDAGSGGAVPPGATLKFEVELFKVNP
ncbi:peptidyl-prolyl cis-trans isomerase, FKBP type [Skeletonema marinoi]|uniref:peptidylprolyl isomerase n=1 Tax=Skeletonema marinoi TaxID=267567 RepID=A0AAD8Y8I9_9STRA|nr:peptidyl-prolyl cis-trans isomerase, FKBP type [Skeletonema marinoi]